MSSGLPTPSAAVDAEIRRHRTADVTLTVLGADGQPLRDAEVTVSQRDHAFLFGNTGFEFIALANDELTPQGLMGATGAAGSLGESQVDGRALADRWLDLFNAATLPFYWGRFEPVRGKPDTQRLLRTARWLADRGVTVKGHPLAWHTVCADWLMDLPSEETAREQVARIHREVTGFAGVIDTWDVINEVVIMPVFANGANAMTPLCREMGRIPLIRMVFDAAREANPHATLLLNDFDLSTAYECLIEGVLEAGIRIDVLGLQSHMHQGYWGEERTLETIDRFARYGLPIHFTESTLVSGELMPPEIEDLNDYQPASWPTTPEGEERQADEVVRHYATLLSHPAVKASTYWGLADGGWLGAPGGFLRADGSVKPSYEALHALVKGAWWLPETTYRTDAEGRVRFNGFLGRYAVSAPGRLATVSLDAPGEVAVTASLS